MILMHPFSNNKKACFSLFMFNGKQKGEFIGLDPKCMSHDVNFREKPISRPDMNKAEHQFNNLVKHLTNIFDDDYDPFFFYLFSRGMVFIDLDRKSSLRIHVTGSGSHSIGTETILRRRKKVEKIYPHRITLSLDKEEVSSIRKYIKTRHYVINKLEDFHKHQWARQIHVDICFKTEYSLDRFVDNYAKGKFSEYTRNGREDIKLKTSTRIPLYGKILKRHLRKWKNFNLLNDFKVSDFTFGFGLFSDREYPTRVGEIHNWASENLEKRFVMMGSYYDETWLFESEEDMNYFMIRWKFSEDKKYAL